MTLEEEIKKPTVYKVKRADLIKYPWIRDDVKKINARLKALRLQMGGHAVNLDSCGKSTANGDNVSYLAGKIADIEKRRDSLEAELKRIERAVNGIPDESAKRLIRQRYFLQKHWKEICKEYNLKRSTAQSRAEKYIE